MNAKQYLSRVRRIDKEISSLRELITNTREALESITQKYDGDVVSGTRDPHKYDRLVELESLVEEKIADQITVKAETLETISMLKDRRQRIILTDHYLNMQTFEKIAVDNHYSWRQVQRIHRSALKEVEVLIAKDVIECHIASVV